MEIIPTQTSKHQLSFSGNGSEFFGILFSNWILTVLTLGFYYPWAKIKRIKYLYENTGIDGSNFSFSGTGKEMFRGFIKSVLIFGGAYAFLIAANISHNITLAIISLLVFLFVFVLIFPMAIHGTLKYRLSRSSFRGINFAYKGNIRTFIKLYLGQIFLTIITLGIYGPWMQVNLRKYIFENARFGSAQFKFEGKGSELFTKSVLGILLVYITVFIYFYWYVKNIIQFYINNSKIVLDGTEYSFECSISAGDIFRISMFYLLGLITLGLAIPFAMVYQTRVIMENIQISGELDLNKLTQAEETISDGTGEAMSDLLDIDLMF